MTAYLILGATLAFAAAVQPGPLMTYLIARTLSAGWRRTLPAALAPVLSDGPIMIATLVILKRVPPRIERYLHLAGGLFLLYLAWCAYQVWRRAERAPSPDSTPSGRGLLQAVGVNLLNPNPYLGWTLVLGPLFLKGWRETPSHGLALLAGFYGTMVLALAGIIMVFALVRSAGRAVSRILLAASVGALALLGVFQILAAVRVHAPG